MEDREALLQLGEGLPVVPQVGIDHTHFEMGHPLEVHIREGGRDGVRALAIGEGWSIMLHLPEGIGETAVDASQAAGIPQPFGKRFRLTQVGQGLLPRGDGCQRHHHVAAQIDGLLQQRARWREVRQGLQGLLPGAHGFPVGRRCRALWLPPAGSRSRPCPTPHLAGHGGQAFDLLAPPLGRECFEGRDNRAWSPRRCSWRRL